MLQGQPSYQEHIAHLRERAREVTKRVIFTGFVPENELPLYFSATDIVLFPYTSGIMSSGSLALALTYEKPFVISEVLAEADTPKSLVFQTHGRELAERIDQLCSDQSCWQLALSYARQLKKGRLWPDIARETRTIYSNRAKERSKSEYTSDA